MKESIYWIWFSRIEGISYREKYTLICKYGSPEKLWRLVKTDLIWKEDLKEKTRKQLVDKKYTENLKSYVQYMEKYEIGILTIWDNRYPQKLKTIYDPPVVLYYQGDISILNHVSIAMVGCRDCSNYGMELAKKFSRLLSEHKINIISGLAKGIDAYSHVGCLKGNAKTIAVIGNGLDHIYPNENKQLASCILKNKGLLLSEYIIGTKPLKRNFPARNRIISGISDGVLVIEAKKKSGTLITVDFALEQGKNVYAIPGNITSEKSIGTNELIKQGAKLVTRIEDVLEDYR